MTVGPATAHALYTLCRKQGGASHLEGQGAWGRCCCLAAGEFWPCCKPVINARRAEEGRGM